MIKLLNQITEYYCSTAEEAEEILSNRKEESVGTIVKHTIEDKGTHTKLQIKEEHDTVVEIQRAEKEAEKEFEAKTSEPQYYEMLDSDGEVISSAPLKLGGPND